MMIAKHKQEAIESYIDKQTGTMGADMIAMIALAARNTVANCKANRFITEFAQNLEVKMHPLDAAVGVLEYVYPANKAYWKLTDKRYIERIKQSAWIKANNNLKTD